MRRRDRKQVRQDIRYGLIALAVCLVVMFVTFVILAALLSSRLPAPGDKPRMVFPTVTTS